MKTILVAEDEINIRRFIQVKLEQVDYRVETAENGRQAWERLKQGGIDLLITDTIMPEMFGIELIELVRASDNELATLPILIMGWRANPGELQMPPPPREPDWMAYWLAKPFNPLELISILDRRFRSLEGVSCDAVQ
jgi:CheY-like chemotaxis protein